MSARARAMKRSKYADGGTIKGVSVPGASVMREAEASNDGFKKGGKAGMTAKGSKSKKRGDKPARKAFGGPMMAGGAMPMRVNPTGPGSGPGLNPTGPGTPPGGGMSNQPVRMPGSPYMKKGGARKAAGGAAKYSRGGSPYSAANKTSSTAPAKGTEAD